MLTLSAVGRLLSAIGCPLPARGNV